MGATPDFGDLRSLMNEPYSRQIWDQLCTWIEQWEPEDREGRVLPYLDGHLHQWLDEERFVPPRWIEQLMEGGGERRYMSITRFLNLRGRARIDRWRAAPTLFNIWEFPSVQSITILDMGHNTFENPDEWKYLYESTHLKSLEELRLTYVDPAHSAPGWLEGLADATFLDQLRAIDLGSCQLEEEELDVLFRSRCSSLRELDLSNNNISINTLKRTHGAFPELESLTLANLSFEKQSPEPLLAFQRLKKLSISKGNLASSHYEALGAAPFAPHLTHLGLWGNQVGRNDAYHLFQKGNFAALRELEICMARFDNEALDVFLKSDHADKIEVLKLDNNMLTDAAIDLLLSSDRLENLKSLNLLNNPTTSEGVRRLKEDSRLGSITLIR